MVQKVRHCHHTSTDLQDSSDLRYPPVVSRAFSAVRSGRSRGRSVNRRTVSPRCECACAEPDGCPSRMIYRIYGKQSSPLVITSLPLKWFSLDETFAFRLIEQPTSIGTGRSDAWRSSLAFVAKSLAVMFPRLQSDANNELSQGKANIFEGDSPTHDDVTYLSHLCGFRPV